MNRFSGARRKLGVRLTLLFLSLALLPLAMVGLVAYRDSRMALEAQQYDHLNAVTMLKADEIERWVRDNTKMLESLAQRPLVRGYAGTLTREEPATAPHQTTRAALLENHLIPALTASGGYWELFLIRAEDGLVLAATNPEEEGKYRENESYFLEGRRRTTVQNVYYALSRGMPLMTIGAPVRDERGQTVAVLAGHVDLDEFSEIAAQASELSTTEDTYLVNDFNFFVTNPRFGDGFALRETIHTDGIAACLSPEDGHRAYVDYRGEPVLGAYRWLPEREMCVLTEIDQAEAFAPIVDLRRSVLSIGVLAVLSLVAAGSLFIRSITRPLHHMVRGTERVGRGDLDYQIELSGEDEIGQLAAAFNRMTANLRDSIGESAHGRRLLGALSDASRAAQKARTPAQVYESVATEMAALGFTTSVLLLTEDKRHVRDHELEIVRPDGSIPTLLLSTALIEYEGKQALLSGFQDVTERKKMEAALRYNEERFRALVQNAGDVITIIDEEAKILYESPAVERILGFQPGERIGQSVLALAAPEDQARVQETFAHLMGSPSETVSLDVRVQHKGGEWRLLEISATNLLRHPAVRGIVVNSHDITARTRAENALRRQRDRFNRLLETSPVGITFVDRQGKITLRIRRHRRHHSGHHRTQARRRGAQGTGRAVANGHHQ